MKIGYVKKSLVVGIIVLFLGVAVAPSIATQINQPSKTSTDSDLIEITIEACGIPELKPHTVKLTKQQAAEIDQLFDNIKNRLDNATTREETEIIYKEAVVELNKYGLLPNGMSIEEAQKLVTGRYQNLKTMKLLEKLYSGHSQYAGKDDNFNCSISGETTQTRSWWNHLWWDSQHIIISLILFLFFDLIDSIIPIKFDLMKRLSLGSLYSGFEQEPEEYPARGWVSTLGTNGKKEWNGSFYGQISYIVGFSISGMGGFTYYVGVTGFTGIWMEKGNAIYFVGNAEHVALGPSIP